MSVAVNEHMYNLGLTAYHVYVLILVVLLSTSHTRTLWHFDSKSMEVESLAVELRARLGI